MPSLKSAKHEMYCQNIVKGMTQKAAHRAAGFAGNTGNASTMHSRPEIQARIAELIEEKNGSVATEINPHTSLDTQREIETAMADGRVSREWIIAQLVENATLARETGQFTPANKSLELLIRMMGYFPAPAGKKGSGLDKGAALPKTPTAPMISYDQINRIFDRIEEPPVEIVVKPA